jgi:hypothetical protein
MSAHLYLYAILASAEARPIAAPAVLESDNPILQIEADGLVAIASRIGVRSVDSTRRNMMAHTRVIERAMDHATVLPTRFGMIAEDEGAVVARLRRHRERLKTDLAALAGHVEVGLRLGFCEGVATREIADERPDLKRESEALARRDPNESYYARIDLGRKVEHALIDKRKREGERLLARFKPFAARTVTLGLSDDQVVANLALLVRREREPDLAAAVEALDREAPGRLAIRYVAPVPPYNFVRLTLEDAAGEGAIEKDAA